MRDGRYVSTHQTQRRDRRANRQGDGRSRHRTALSQGRCPDRRSRPDRQRPVSPRRFRRDRFRGPGGRDRRRSPGWWVRDARRSPARYPGSTVRRGQRRPGRLSAQSPDAQSAIDAGMGFVPEDRRKQGLVMDLSVARNTTLTLRKALARLGLINSTAERRWPRSGPGSCRSRRVRSSMRCRLSPGGNQQKVVLAKWLATKPRLLIVDEPTRGIDVGTKSRGRRTPVRPRRTGIAIVMISSELPEVLGMADRVLVMHEGRITANLSRADADPESVMHAGDGIDRSEHSETHAGWAFLRYRCRFSRCRGRSSSWCWSTFLVNPQFLSGSGGQGPLLNSTT